MLCNYGCGQEAEHQFKNGKWCCSKKWTSCIYTKEEKKKKTKDNCDGRRRQSEYMKKEGSVYASSFITEEVRRKQANGSAQRTKENNESRRKQAEKLIGRTKDSHEGIRRQAEKQSIWMKKNGYNVRKHIKRESKEEVRLRNIIKDLYPMSEHTFHVLNYDVDIVIPEYKIAIEYDGWHHFNIPGRKEYDIKRQKEIESLGWKFLRYNIYQKFPSVDQVKIDIERVL